MLPAGQTAAIITTVANNLQMGISERLSVMFSSIAMIIGSLVIAFMYDWILTVATSLGLVLIGVVYYGITPQIASIMAVVLEQDIKAASVAAEALSPTAVRMLAACGAQDKIVKRYSLLVDEGHRKGRKMAPLVAWQNGLSKSNKINLDTMRYPSILIAFSQFCCICVGLVKMPRDVVVRSLTGRSTFALAFWVAFKLYTLMEINSPEPLIV